MKKEKQKTINIMGTEYKVYLIGKPHWADSDRDGVCNVDKKEIRVLLDGTYSYIKHVLHHEIVHAMFYECGLANFFSNETLVDFVALQLNKFVTATDEGTKILDKEFEDDEQEGN